MRISDWVKQQPKEKVARAKAKLLFAVSVADRESGTSNDRWADAILHLDTEPERLTRCNTILHDAVKSAINDA